MFVVVRLKLHPDICNLHFGMCGSVDVLMEYQSWDHTGGQIEVVNLLLKMTC
jgi:hypothetical protein